MDTGMVLEPPEVQVIGLETPVITWQPPKNTKMIVGATGYRNWTVSLFSCTDDYDNCAFAIGCLPCLLDEISKKLDDTGCMPFCACWSLTAMRTKLRTMGGIKGTVYTDCLASNICAPCTICQMIREMDAMKM